MFTFIDLFELDTPTATQTFTFDCQYFFSNYFPFLTLYLSLNLFVHFSLVAFLMFT